MTASVRMTTPAPVVARRRRIGILVFDGVKMLDYTGPAEVFVEANQSLPGYDVVTVSPDGGPVVTSLGTRVCATSSALEAGKFDTVLIPGSELPPARFVTPEVLAATTQMARHTGDWLRSAAARSSWPNSVC